MITSRLGARVRSRRSLAIAAVALCLTSCGTPEPSTEERPQARASAPVNDGLVASPSAPETRADGLNEPLPTAAPAPLTEAGWGPLRIGMTRAEVVAAAGEDANPNAVGGPEPEVCDEFRPERAPEGMLVMIQRGRLTRITSSAASGVATERGFEVGDLAAPIKDAYGADAVISPHKYWPAPAEYITVWMTPPAGPDARGLVYEIARDGRVAHIHAGGTSIQNVEGCL